MRRGLINRSLEEVSDATLEARLAAVQAALRDAGQDALLVYTDTTRPSAVSRLVAFVPYWNRGVLVVPAEGGPALVCALSNRVSGWIRETSALEDVVCTPDLLGGIQSLLPKDGIGVASGASAKLGIVDMDSFPNGLLGELATAIEGATFADATDLLEAALAGAPGLSKVLVSNALAVGEAALASARAAFRDGDGLAAIAAAEKAARYAGAEEVLIAVAPDAQGDPRLRRLEGSARFGTRMFIRVSVAYKGYWYRIGETLQADAGVDPALQRAAEMLRGAAQAGSNTPDPAAIPARLATKCGAGLLGWSLEGPRGTEPLARLAGPDALVRTPLNGLLSLTLHLELPQGRWYGAHPLLVANAA